jgi:hypothetical protein
LDEAAEIARVMKIEQLLDVMNTASNELNAFQKVLGSIEASRCKAVQLWAVGSARLARAIGDDRISRAALYHRYERELASARRQVVAASAAFLKASEECSSYSRREKIARRHAKQVAEYQTAQQHLLKSSKSTAAPPSWLIESTAPYFKAEAHHLSHLDEIKVAETRCLRQIAKAKSRYHSALRDLEYMSEAEHRARGTIV